MQKNDILFMDLCKNGCAFFGAEIPKWNDGRYEPTPKKYKWFLTYMKISFFLRNNGTPLRLIHSNSKRNDGALEFFFSLHIFQAKYKNDNFDPFH